MRKKTLGFAGSFIAAGLAAWLLTGDGTAPPKNTGFSGSLGDQASGGFVVAGQAVSIDTIRVVYSAFRDSAQSFRGAEYDAAVSAADHVVYLINEDFGDPTSFAYGIGSPHTATTSPDSNSTEWFDTSNLYYRMEIHGTNGQDIESTNDLFFLYVDFDSLFSVYRTDSQVEVLSAVFKTHCSAGQYFTGTDSLSATLNTVAADSVWRNNKGILYNSRQWYNQSFMNGHYQTKFRPGGSYQFPDGTGGSPAWNPTLAARDSFHDYSAFRDFTGGAWTGSPSFSANDPFDIKLTNCVQAVAEGEVNNGIVITYDDLSDNIFYIYNVEPRHNASMYGGFPWVEVVFTTKNYTKPFPGGKDFAFIFSSDDGRDINRAWADVFASHDAAFTIYVTGNRSAYFGGTEAEAYADSLKNWHDLGMEIGYHSMWHNPNIGTQGYDVRPTGHALFDTVDYSRGMSFDTSLDPPDTFVVGLPEDDTNTTGWDSLMTDLDPARIYQLMDYYYPGNGYRQDSTFMKTFAYPVSTRPNGSVMKALNLFGYVSWRSSGTNAHEADNRRELALEPSATGGVLYFPTNSNYCDSARAGYPINGRTIPYNIRAITTSGGIDWITGGDATEKTETEIKTHVRDIVRDLLANDRDALILYSHDVKNTGGYSAGIDTDELGWVIEQVQAMNGWVCTHQQYTAWVTHMRGLTWIDTPAGYSQHDSLRFTAEDQVWIQFEY